MEESKPDFETRQNLKNNPRILIMAGGTGGHVFPGLAVATRIKEQGFEVLWLGTKNGLEAEIIPKHSIPIRYLTITGLRGKGLLIRLLAPIRLMLALYQSIRILQTFKPDVVLGMGGFVTGPGGVAAWLLRYPLVIHEQNAIAGMTNRWLSRLAKRVLEGFPGSFSKSTKAIWVGNPVRETFGEQPPPEVRLAEFSQEAKANTSSGSKSGSRSGGKRPLRLLIIGGSQGAEALNQMLPLAYQQISKEFQPEIWHQTGRRNFESTQSLYQSLYKKIGGEQSSTLVESSERVEPSIRVEPFIDDMASAYAWSDLVICRSGALTVAELSMVGVGSLLVPFPFAVDDHQTYNGRFLEQAGAAKLIPQKLLDPKKLADVITDFSQQPRLLLEMAEAARRVAKPAALNQVITHCIEVSRESKFKSKS